MSAKDYEIILCKDGHLYINFRDGNDFRSKDSKMLSEDDIAEIKKWFKKQSVSEDDALDLEIRRFLREVHDRDTTISDVARHFAQWQRKRDEKEINEVRITEYERGLYHGKDELMKDAVDCFSVKRDVAGISLLILNGEAICGVNDGDKVKVVILKEK